MRGPGGGARKGKCRLTDGADWKIVLDDRFDRDISKQTPIKENIRHLVDSHLLHLDESSGSVILAGGRVMIFHSRLRLSRPSATVCEP